MIFLHLCIY